MNQSITVNITDGLPQLGAADTLLTNNMLPLIIMAVLLIAAVAVLIGSKRLKTARRGGVQFKNRALYLLPLLVLAPLTVQALAPTNNSSNDVHAAPVIQIPAVTVDDELVINIPQGQTTGSATFNFAVTGFTGGYDLEAQLDMRYSHSPADTQIELDGRDGINGFEAFKVYDWTVGDPVNTQLTITVTVPDDAPVTDEYAYYEYYYEGVDHAYYTFQDPAVVGLTDPAAIYFDPNPTTGVCATEMVRYPTWGGKPHTVKVTDTRNGQVYRVRKLPYTGTSAGKCWMIDNLKLADVSLTSTDSDVNSAVTLPAAATSGASNATTLQVWDATAACAAADPSAYGYSSGMTAFSRDSLTGCGYLYNWYAATATTGTAALTSTYATGSICPAGWSLPDKTRVDYANLSSGMESVIGNSAAAWRNWWPGGAFDGAIAGTYDSNFPGDAGNFGHYWGAMADTADYVAQAWFKSNDMDATANAAMHKRFGIAVRCLL